MSDVKQAVHISFLMGQYAPCGAKVSTQDMKEKIHPSTEDLERVTCSYCQRSIRETAKKFNKARRLKTINWAVKK